MDTWSELLAGKLTNATQLQLSNELTELPTELLQCADSLETLDLSNNRLQALPDWFEKFSKLRTLFLSKNCFREYPEVLGRCPQLSMVGFKSNAIESVPEAAISRDLRWLILTDNQIRELPESLGRCSKLQKLMLAGNKLSALPASLSACQNLELLRISANDFEAIPDWLFALPKLAWLALAGNPIPELAPSSLHQSSNLPVYPWNELELGQAIGQGASGVTYRARILKSASRSRDVAVKIYNGAITSDGRPLDEHNASLACGTHPNLLTAEGIISEHPDGKQGIIMRFLDDSFRNLAAPPSFTSCTRDVYQEATRFPAAIVKQILCDITAALEHLHMRGVVHGDLYAHNILVSSTGSAMLGDFGAATCFAESESALAKRAMDVEQRALNILTQELIDRVVS